MKTSTPEQIRKPSPLSILLIGPPGGGKTTLAMQFPNTLWMECDENLAGPELLIRKGLEKRDPITGKTSVVFPANPKLAYDYCPIRTDDDGKPLAIEACFDRLTAELDKAKQTNHSTVVVDNLTHVNEFIIRKIITTQKRSEMEARDWIPFKSHFYSLIVSKLRGLGKNTICTVHESILTEPDPKNIMHCIVKGYRPSVQGSIVDFFGGFFTDMWRCEARIAPGGKIEYWVVTNRTVYSDLKNSLSMPNEINVTGGAAPLLKYLEGRI